MTLYRVLFKDRSLWVKFSLAIVLPIFLVTALLVLHIMESVEKGMLERTRSATEEMTRQAALSLSNASAIYNKTLLDNFVDSLENDPEIVYAMIVDRSDGRILAHSDHRWDGQIFKPSSNVPLNTTEGAAGPPAAEVEQLTSFITSEDKIYGTLMVGYSAAVVEKEVDTFRRQVLSMAV